MKHLIIFALFLAFISTDIVAQKLVKAEEIPSLVQRRFKQKFRKAEKIKWFANEKEQLYTAKYLINGVASTATINMSGTVIKSTKVIELKELNNKIAADLKKNHRDLKAQSALLIEEGRKNKYYSIVLHKSRGRKKEPLVYEIQYDFQGKYLTMYEPEEEDIVEEEKTDKYDQQLQEEMDDLSSVEYNVDIKKSDLPSKAVNYLKKHFDRDYGYSTIRLNNDDDLGPHYYVEMRKIGQGITYQFWFNIKGKLIKKDTEEK